MYKKYLAILGSADGEMTRDRTRWLKWAYTFESKSDREASGIMDSYLKDNSRFTLEFLGCITGGIKVKRINLSKIISIPNNQELSPLQKEKIGFSAVDAGKDMLDQLQPYDPIVRKKRLQEIKIEK